MFPEKFLDNIIVVREGVADFGKLTLHNFFINPIWAKKEFVGKDIGQTYSFQLIVKQKNNLLVTEIGILLVDDGFRVDITLNWMPLRNGTILLESIGVKYSDGVEENFINQDEKILLFLSLMEMIKNVESVPSPN